VWKFVVAALADGGYIGSMLPTDSSTPRVPPNPSLNRTRDSTPPTSLISFWPCGVPPSRAGWPKRQVTSMRTLLSALALAFWMIGGANAVERPETAWHPLLFSMVESWISDVESPVVTEINLDAVQRNRNQFDRDEVKQEGGWVVYRSEGNGFKRYRVIEHKDKYFKVEYQDNGGGTLTTGSRIGFSVERREMLVDGKTKTINVLRVISYSR